MTVYGQAGSSSSSSSSSSSKMMQGMCTVLCLYVVRCTLWCGEDDILRCGRVAGAGQAGSSGSSMDVDGSSDAPVPPPEPHQQQGSKSSGSAGKPGMQTHAGMPQPETVVGRNGGGDCDGGKAMDIDDDVAEVGG